MVVDALESISLVVELREAVTRAVDDTEDLRHREDEVKDLRQEEEEHGLCEVAEDANHCERHPCEIAEGISDKDFRGEFVVLDESKCHHNEGDDDCEGEDVLRDDLWRGAYVYFL